MLEVGGRGWGSLRDLSKNILKQGVGKGKSCSQGGGGFEGGEENFNHTHFEKKSGDSDAK